MIIKGKLDEDEKESREWVRKTLQSCSSSAFPNAKLVSEESLITVLADIRFTQHEIIRTLASMATKIHEREES
jgi:hypothetical protein